MIKKLDAKFALLLTAVAAIVVLMLGWLALVTPERSKAAQVSEKIAQSQTQLAAAEALVAPTARKRTMEEFAVASRVLPTDPQMSQVLRELEADAASSNTQINAVTPAGLTVVGTAQAIPISLQIQGRYFGIRHFLHVLQQGATIQGGRLTGTGRLFSVESITFATSQSGAPTAVIGSTGSSSTPLPPPNTVTATISADVYIAGAPPATTPTTTTGDSSTSSTSTTAASAAP